ncbi:ImmA/IrrE family metallo-endopeptidase [Selenomonas noxia]|jgi:hypothetical protein|uniref:ImmA/IrrE family metallo-endopeptidase n=1 Tax=Selenomonas noxia TaxID=135083 RepID=UPI002358E8D3|nr:ImmA/IrrE family metallo-endopeptidase [Selenomonas noxia]
MASVTVPIHAPVIDWIVQNIHEEQGSPDVLDLLNAWKTGEKQPTLKQLEVMSKKTHIPFGYFLLRTPPKEDIALAEYRTIGSKKAEKPSRALIDILDQMTAIQDWMRDELKREQADALPFVGSSSLRDSADEIARQIRDVLALKTNWFRKGKNAEDNFNRIRNALAQHGVLVFTGGKVGANTHRPLDIKEFRAFTLINALAPLIFINTTDTANGRLFSLLHETAHVWLGKNSLFNRSDWSDAQVSLIEQKCNAVAAELLVPAADFQSVWDASIPIEEMIETAARYFRCSEAVILRRAYETKNLPQDVYTRMLALQKEHWERAKAQKKKSNGGDFYNTLLSNLDHRFLSALERSVIQGNTQDTDAYRLTATNRKTYRTALEKMGGV